MNGPASTQALKDVLAVFDRWADAAGDERASLLDDLRERRPELHARLLAMIEADRAAQSQDFLATGVLPSVPPAASAPTVLPSREGLRLGAWELREPIGAGGMGEVWLAARSDGLYDGRAAIKLLHGLRTHALAEARFAREGELLGRLSHPHVARLLDAGITPEGTRYLVLEHVQGQRLDQWCDARRLDIRARLALFLQTCQAVSYAHANLVVHRDLKPANVLVTDEGQVKLLDFGVAKLLGDDDTRDSELTRAAAAGLTPEYASPEQVNGAPISTATDIYALGVMLFNMLSGARPYAATASTPARLAREIVEDEPRVLTNVPIEPDAAAARSTTPARLTQAVRGDLTQIVARALRKLPAERYASVQALADDITRHLNHEPVSAQPPDWRYRSAKFVARHRAGVAASMLVAAAVVAGVGATLWQAQKAREENARATAIKDFVVGVFKTASTGDDPGSGANPERTVRSLVREGGERLLDDRSVAPSARLELQSLLGQLNFELDNHDIAVKLEEEALRSAVDLHGARSPQALAAKVALAEGLPSQRKAADALRLCQEVIATAESLGATDSASYAKALLQAGSLSDHEVGDLQASGGYLRRAVDVFERHQPDHEQRSSAHRWLGNTLQQLNDFEGAEAQYHRALEVSRLTGAQRAIHEGQITQVLGALHMRTGRYTDAVPMLERAVAIVEGTKGKNQMQSHQIRALLARSWHQVGRRYEAYALLERLRALIPTESYKGAGNLLDRIDSAAAQMTIDDGSFARARPILAALIERVPKGGPAHGSWLTGSAEVEWQLGDHTRAEAFAREGLAITAKRLGEASPNADRARLVLAEALEAAGARGDALKQAHADLVLVADRGGDTTADRSPATIAMRVRAKTALARMALAEDPKAALRLAHEAIAALPAKPVVLREQVVLAQARLVEGRALEALGQRDAARAVVEAGVALIEAHQVADSPRLAEARHVLAGLGGLGGPSRGPAPPAVRPEVSKGLAQQPARLPLPHMQPKASPSGAEEDRATATRP